MSTVNEILSHLLSFAPREQKEDWDNIGLLCGHASAEVSRVLVALDVTMEVAQEAQSCGAELVVSHHPLLFSLKSISDETAEGRLLLYLAEHNIAVISMHTNLDSASGGVNDRLAACLGLTNVRTFSGDSYGIGRIGEATPQPLEAFAAFVRSCLHAGGVRYSSGGKPVAHVAVGGGACMDFLPQAIAAGCDTFVTGDIKYHQFQKAQALGINLIDAGHFPTENPICDVLCRLISEKFPQLTVHPSQTHTDCVKFA